MNTQCNNEPIGTEEEWLRLLGQGKLNKSINHKIRLYSYIRDLSARQHTYQSEKTAAQDTFEPLLDAETLSGPQDGKLQDLPVSPVILEDYAMPPPATEEMPVLYFQPGEFYDYLLSDKWSGTTSLRVVGGELLSLTLTALNSLEMHRKINPHMLRANLNNRHLEKTSDSSHEEMMYEKLGIQLIYYEKAEMSNLPVRIVGNVDPLATPKTVLLTREIVEQPYVKKRYKPNKITGLCPDENVNPLDVISKLEEELVTAREKRAVAATMTVYNDKNIKDTRRTGTKSTELVSTNKISDPLLIPVANTEPFEYISEDPNLILSIVKRQSSKPKIEAKKVSVPAIFLERVVAAEKPASVHPIPATTVSAQLSESSMDDSAILSPTSASSRELANVEENDTSDVTLNPTQNEFYVTGLYDARSHNIIACQEKLKVRKEIRSKKQREKENLILKETLIRAKTDLITTFKHLSKRKEVINNGISSIKREKILDKGDWNHFQADHEDCEMQIAKKSEFENGVLNRLQDLMLKPKVLGGKVDNKTVKGKYDKIKSAVLNRKTRSEEDYEKYRKDENENKANLQFNCSQPFVNMNNLDNLEVPFNVCEWRDALLQALASWRHNLDKGIYFQGTNSTSYTIFQNVYFTTPYDKNTCGKGKKHDKIHLKQETDYCSKIIPKKVNTILRKNICQMTRNTKTGSRNILLCESHKRNVNSSNKNNNMQNENSDGTTEPADVLRRQTSVVRLSHKSSVVMKKAKSRVKEKADSVSSVAEQLGELHHRSSILHEGGALGAKTSLKQASLPPVEATISEQLNKFNISCPCIECISQEPLLRDLRPDPTFEPRNGYPLKLGKLRTDYTFLEYKNMNPSILFREKTKPFAFVRVGITEIADRILDMINDIVVRKEILSTSLGQTFITVTFTKSNVIMGLAPSK